MVLSRSSFLDMVVSHRNFDDGPLSHANVLAGYLILISRFLEGHRYYYHDDNDGGGGDGSGVDAPEKLWTILNTDRISSKYYTDKYLMGQARLELIGNLTRFLGWSNSDCGDCFHHWVDNGRTSTSDTVALLGNKNVKKLRERMVELEGIWPPREE